jgi:ribonuclease P protein component
VGAGPDKEPETRSESRPGSRPESREARRGPFSFPRSKRLRTRGDFLRARSRGDRIHGRRFIYYIAPGATSESRLGITVSKKVGNAVRRNQIKRRVREAFRLHPHLFPRPVDVIVIAKQDGGDFGYAEVRDELIDVITRYFAGRGRDGRGGRAGRGARRRGPRARGDRDPRREGL